VYKRVRVLSGGERTRLAVARMLLRPSNLLLLDEPTNHLDLDSKEVLLDALADYGGTLMFVSHDRYFVERLATKIVEVGHGQAIGYPGSYREFLWHKAHLGQERRDQHEHREQRTGRDGRHRHDGGQRGHTHAARPSSEKNAPAAAPSREAQKRADAEARRKQRAAEARRAALAKVETQIAECETAIRELEQAMAAPGFYDDRTAAQPLIDRHQALMWQVGELMHQWEELQEAADLAEA
jgi:ATP-binding cassette subfamily F protein 3